MSDRFSKIRIGAIFVIVLVQVFSVQCVCMFMIYLRTKFHMSGGSVSLVLSIKPTGQPNLRTAAMFLFYIL
jgi:hypothetical protein